MENSILAAYVTDEKNDGTYTLQLGEKATRELWEKVDAQTKKIEELAVDSASAWAARQHLHDFMSPENDLALAAKRASDECSQLRAELAAKQQAHAELLERSNANWDKLKAQRLLGLKFGVSPSAIQNIVDGNAWKHVT